jgi:hypothetical protein
MPIAEAFPAESCSEGRSESGLFRGILKLSIGRVSFGLIGSFGLFGSTFIGLFAGRRTAGEREALNRVWQLVPVNPIPMRLSSRRCT